MEFGSRRAFSPQASIWAARAALAAGLDATSNVLAALKLDRQPAGTMAHSLVMGLDAKEGSEMEAFRAFHRYFPGATLLIDTFDTVTAARDLARQIEAGEMCVKGVRLDSGDLVELSKQVRSLLPEVSIFASGDLNEWRIAELRAAGAAIDGYGVGTCLVTGSPLNGVYKLVDIDGIPVMKKSKGKATYPARKQIFRRMENGTLLTDRLGLQSESAQPGEQTLMELWVEGGTCIKSSESLQEIARRTAISVAQLPEPVRRVERPEPSLPRISQRLRSLTHETQRQRH